MKEEALKHLLESILGKSKSARGGNEAVFKCPSCNHHKKKLTVNLSTQKYQCWVCGTFKGHRAFKLLKAVEAPPATYEALKQIDKQYDFKYKKIKLTPQESLHLPEGVIPLISSSAILSRHANHYLTQRGITQQDIVKYDIHYSETGDLKNMVVIPSYGSNGFLNYYVGRSFDKDSYIKHKLAPSTKDIVGFEILINWDLPVILCEGAFDAMTIKRNAIPLFGKKISASLMKMIIKSKSDSIYIALDNDAFLDAFEHAKKFISIGKNVHIIEMDEKDPNELGFEKFTELLYKSQPTTIADLIRKRLSLL